MSAETSTVFTKQSLFEHAAQRADRTFISIHENVYDVTEFLDEHPGGEEALKEHQIKDNHFKDATEAFEDVGHSMDARDMMRKFQVGVLEGKKERAPKKQAAQKQEQQSSGSWSFMLLPALALIGVALAYQYFAHRQ